MLVEHASRTTITSAQGELVGRDEEANSLSEWLTAGGAVQLHGPRGVGKTSLARTTLQGWTAANGRPLWVDLSRASTPLHAWRAVAHRLQLHWVPEDGPRRIGSALRRHAAPLLVLDGAEVLGEHATALSEWLVAAPDLRLLLTSETPLVGWGASLWVEPLPTDHMVALISALAKSRGLELPEDPGLHRLCHALQGLPEAAVLAAGALHDSTPAALATELEARDDSHTEDAVGVLREGTLDRVLEVTHAALPEPLQHALAQCTAFASPLSLDAAHAVVEPGEGQTVAELLEGLQQRGWLQPIHDGRLSPSTSARAFLARTVTDTPAAALRHVAWCAGHGGEALRQDLRTSRRTSVLDTLEPLDADLVTAMTRGARLGASEGAVASLEAWAALCRRRSATPEAMQAMQAMLDRSLPSELKVRAQLAAAEALQATGDEASAWSAVDAGLAQVEPTMASDLAADLRLARARLQLPHDPAAATADLDEALARFTELQSVPGQRLVHEQRARAKTAGGDLPGACDDLRTLLDERGDDPAWRSERTMLLGDTLARLGQLEGASLRYAEASRLAQQRLPTTAAMAMGKLARVQVAQGRFAEALALLDASAQLHDRHSPRALAILDRVAGVEALRHLGRIDAAWATLEHAAADVSGPRRGWLLAVVAATRGALLADRGAIQDAVGALREAATRFEDQGDRAAAGNVLQRLGGVLPWAGQADQARPTLERATEAAPPVQAALAAAELAALLLGSGPHEPSVDALEAALDRLGDTPHEQAAVVMAWAAEARARGGEDPEPALRAALRRAAPWPRARGRVHTVAARVHGRRGDLGAAMEHLMAAAAEWAQLQLSSRSPPRLELAAVRADVATRFGPRS
ncbi:MAG: hypothetical protein KTR31_13425 [Myxococcales bacterium]|nr:hypothetical protein [Myxococcales bacterium]